MNLKSISSVIATILIVVIVVGLSAFAYFSFSGTMSKILTGSTQEIQQTTRNIVQCTRIGGNIYVDGFSFKYRIPINITENSGNNLTDYQVLLIINTQQLISQGKMRSDCSDIRFTYYNSTSNTEVKIPY